MFVFTYKREGDASVANEARHDHLTCIQRCLGKKHQSDTNWKLHMQARDYRLRGVAWRRYLLFITYSKWEFQVISKIESDLNFGFLIIFRVLSGSERTCFIFYFYFRLLCICTCVRLWIENEHNKAYCRRVLGPKALVQFRCTAYMSSQGNVLLSSAMTCSEWIVLVKRLRQRWGQEGDWQGKGWW